MNMVKKGMYFWALMMMNVLWFIMIITSAFTENLTCVPMKNTVIGNNGEKSYAIDSSCNYIKT